MADWILHDIAEWLEKFVELDHRRYFEQDFEELLYVCTTDVCLTPAQQEVFGHVEKLPAYRLLEDPALMAEVGTFVDELQHWRGKIEEIRCQWFYDHITNELPQDYLAVFGYTSPAVMRLERIRQRASRILLWIKRKLPAKPATEWRQNPDGLIPRKDLLKLLGITTGGLTKRIQKQGFPPPAVLNGDKHMFRVAEVDAWLEKQSSSKNPRKVR
jgi:predicted DNA-binding transcriptional regulator AlpA